MEVEAKGMSGWKRGEGSASCDDRMMKVPIWVKWWRA